MKNQRLQGQKEIAIITVRKHRSQIGTTAAMTAAMKAAMTVEMTAAMTAATTAAMTAAMSVLNKQSRQMTNTYWSHLSRWFQTRHLIYDKHTKCKRHHQWIHNCTNCSTLHLLGSILRCIHYTYLYTRLQKLCRLT